MANAKKREKKAYIKNQIDNTPGKINLEHLYNPRALEDEAKRVFEIDRENMELLKNINIIMRTKGRIDCWKTGVTEDRDYKSRKDENLRISQENVELYDRIQKTVGLYSAAAAENRRNSKNENKSSMVEKDKKSKTKASKNTSLSEQSSIVKNPEEKCPQCFFDLEMVEPNQKFGRIIIELYQTVVPKTCNNFLAFCTGTNGLSYQNTPFHRIISGYLCQGGDVTKHNGTGGTSIYGDYFEDENFQLNHSVPGIMSMYNTGKDTNNSKFNLTFKKLQILDGKNVVFGRVISGLANIYKIEALGTTLGRPRKKIIISKCGLC